LFAARCGRIDGIGDTLISDSFGVSSGRQLEHVLGRAPQPVEPPDRQHIDRSERMVHALQAKASELGATDRFLDDLLATCSLPGVTRKSGFCSVVEALAFAGCNRANAADFRRISLFFWLDLV
jgi:hypothetical protein